MSRSIALLLAALGAVSGCISWMLMIKEVTAVGAAVPIPGLSFGIVFGILFVACGKLDARRGLLYALAAGLGYYLAVWVTFFSIVLGTFLYLGAALVRQRNPSGGTETLLVAGAGILGGLAGSASLGLASTFLLRVPAALALRLPMLVGAAAGALVASIKPGSIDSTVMPKTFLIFFALWQGAYAASLVPLLEHRARGGE